MASIEHLDTLTAREGEASTVDTSALSSLNPDFLNIQNPATDDQGAEHYGTADENHPGIDLYRLYVRQAAKEPLLTREEETELAKRVEAGLYAGRKLAEVEQTKGRMARPLRRDLLCIQREGETAHERLIMSNTRLVISIAKKYQGVDHMSLLDLVQEGNIGLMHAIEKFDYRKDMKVSTYATWWIKQEIERAIQKQSLTIYLPLERYSEVRKVAAVRDRLHDTMGRPPEVAEISAHTGLTVERVSTALEIRNREPLSLDMPVGHDNDDDSMTLGDAAAETAVEADLPLGLRDLTPTERNTMVARYLVGLVGPREQHILAMYYGLNGEPMSTLEIAQKLGISSISRNYVNKLRLAAQRAIAATPAGQQFKKSYSV